MSEAKSGAEFRDPQDDPMTFDADSDQVVRPALPGPQRLALSPTVQPDSLDPTGFPMRLSVPSSQAAEDPYTVTLSSASVGTCTCKGFAYRSRCRHIPVAINKARAEGRLPQ